MKTVKPNYVHKKEEKITPLGIKVLNEPETKTIDKLNELTQVSQELGLFDDIMQQVISDKEKIIKKEPTVIDNKYVCFEITLTKKQYAKWLKNGGEKWLKKKLIK